MSDETLQAIFPFAMTVDLAILLFFVYSFWSARLSRVRFSEQLPGAVESALQSLPHNLKLAYQQRGWVVRPEWLRLCRNVGCESDNETYSKPGLVKYANTNRKGFRVHAPFDPELSMKGEDGSEVRFLTNPLATTYLVEPLTYCLEGMIPPVDLELSALFMEILVRSAHVSELTFGDRIWNRQEKRARDDALLRTADQIVGIINRSELDRAAFKRVLTTWTDEVHGVPGFLRVFVDVLRSAESTAPKRSE